MANQQNQNLGESTSPKRAFTEKEAAKYIGMSRSFLRQGRMDGVRINRTPPPAHCKIGRRAIRYLIEVLDGWLDQHKVVDQRGDQE